MELQKNEGIILINIKKMSENQKIGLSISKADSSINESAYEVFPHPRHTKLSSPRTFAYLPA